MIRPPPRAEVGISASRRMFVARGTLIITLVTLAAHGLALFDDVVLDDYWHQRGLRTYGWSFTDLMRTLDISPSDFLGVWWQTQEVKWHYLRPFFIVCMKFVYGVIGGENPVALHAFSLFMHLASALLVWRLCWLLMRHESYSILGGILFAIYPHSVITVAWPSSQNVVIQTTLLLAVMLLYIRASGLDLARADRPRKASGPVDIPALSRRHTAWAFALWLLAIFTRENAVLLPAILASFDLAFGGVRHLWRRRGVYLAFLIVGAAFAAWREWMGIHPLPDVYCIRPDGNWAEYLPWLAAKFPHYVCVAVWPAPMTAGPTGRYAPWSTATGDCLLMLGIVAIVGGVYWRAARRARGWWIWPLWIAMSVLPVTALVATPHSGYMCGVGFAAGFALAVTLGCDARRRPRGVRVLTGVTAAVVFLGMAFMTPVNRLQWSGIAAAEQYLPSWVKADPPPQTTRDVFFINLPFVNIYAKPNLVARLGPSFEDVNVHALTFAPHVVQMDRRTIVEQLDERSFTVAVEGQAYFSRLVGRFLLEGFRGKELFAPGDHVAGKAFDVDIVEADERGVWKLKFTFPRPLTDPSYCFYLASSRCGAARRRFTGPAAPAAIPDRTSAPSSGAISDPVELMRLEAMLHIGNTAAAGVLFETAISGELPAANQASAALRPVASYMATALGAPVQSLLDDESPSPDEWRRVRDWWRAQVDQRAMDTLWVRRHDFDDLLWLRFEIEWDRAIAAFFLRSDLYLSGPPFDDPRGW